MTVFHAADGPGSVPVRREVAIRGKIQGLIRPELRKLRATIRTWFPSFQMA
jgi:hypothetical protein